MYVYVWCCVAGSFHWVGTVAIGVILTVRNPQLRSTVFIFPRQHHFSSPVRLCALPFVWWKHATIINKLHYGLLFFRTTCSGSLLHFCFFFLHNFPQLFVFYKDSTENWFVLCCWKSVKPRMYAAFHIPYVYVHMYKLCYVASSAALSRNTHATESVFVWLA